MLVAAIFVLIGCKKSNGPGAQLEVTATEIQPDSYFYEATVQFANKDYKKSAEFIHKAIQSMELISTVVDEDQRTELKNSIAELNDLETRVSVDKVDGLEELNYFFARAGSALAGLHMHVSETEYVQLNGSKAGKELKRALGVIKNTIKYYNHQFDAEENSLIEKISMQADEMEKGNNVSQEDLKASLKLLKSHLGKWSDELEINYIDFKRKREEIILHTK